MTAPEDEVVVVALGQTRRGIKYPTMNDGYVKSYRPHVNKDYPWWVEAPKGNEDGGGGWYTTDGILEIWPDVVSTEIVPTAPASWTATVQGVAHAIAPYNPEAPYFFAVNPKTTCCGRVLDFRGQAKHQAPDCPAAVSQAWAQARQAASDPAVGSV